MKINKTAVFAVCCLLGCLCTGHLYGQLHVDTVANIRQLVNRYFLTGTVKAFNIKYKGDKTAIGVFRADTSSFNIQKGIILSTGMAKMAEGPNDKSNSGVFFDHYYRQEPDKDLAKIARGDLYDQAILEFDFIPVSDSISFKYVFGSEEYPEYVDKQFNDVFAFFLSGPGIKGIKNLAVLPGTQIPISINTVNSKRNSGYFVNNYYYLNSKTWKPIARYRNKKYASLLGKYIQYDGYTTVLYAKSAVIPNQTYHIKIIIADVSDNIYDSGVFLQARSFISYARDNDTTTNRPIIHINQLPDSIHRDSVFKTISLHINFAFNSDVIPDSAFGSLNEICSLLKKMPDAKVKIYGHTDGKGEADYNLDLSNRRAASAARYIADCGIDSARISYQGRGMTEPVAGNDTEEGRARNRRVVFEIIR